MNQSKHQILFKGLGSNFQIPDTAKPNKILLKERRISLFNKTSALRIQMIDLKALGPLEYFIEFRLQNSYSTMLIISFQVRAK